MSQGDERSQINISGIDLEWRPEQGTCTFAKLPVAMMWVDTTLAGLMAGVQAMVGTERFALALQSEGRKSVEADWQIIAQHPDFADGFRAIANIAAVAGWGHWELVKLDREHRKAWFTVKDSWEGSYQKAIGVCWGSAMLAGKLAGYCSKLFATNCWAEQTKFIANGDGHDEFMVGPSLRLVEKEIENLLATDEATRADMVVALKKLAKEIAQRKQKEQELSGAYEALSASQAELGSIFRAAPIGIGMVVDRMIQEANDAFCAMTGYARGELLGQSARLLYPTQEEFEHVGRVKYKMIAEQGSGTVETHWRTKGGRILDILLSSSPLDTSDWSKGVTFTALDITERRGAEEALRRSEDKFAKAFHSSPDALVISRANDGLIVDINEGFSALTGYTREEALGRTALSLNLWANPQDRENYIAALLKQTKVHDVEFDFCTKSGGILNCLFSAELISLGDELHVLSIVRDVTESKRVEQERREMERRLLHSQKLESLGVLAGGIAHDFNNLLMAITGNLDLALLDLSSDAPSRKYLEQAMHASQRASDLTRQMLAYAGKGRFVLEGIDLAELVLENAHLLKASIAKTASLNLVVTPGLSPIQADPGQVQQVIMNLITNASEAIGDAAGVITITTGEQEFDEAYLSQSRVEQKPSGGRFVYVEVSDSGCGMNQDTLQRLFEPFFTTKFTGRGLGMSAALGIVRGHKGAMVVESEVGRGSIIRVLFPIAESVAKRKSADSSTAVSPEPTSLFSGTALIVDDEETVRQLCAAYIGRLGLKTLAAADGKQALELFSKHAGEIVCVVLDLNMPHMDGVCAFHELKRLQPDIQVILCSGYNEQAATQHFYGEGLAAFIQKPYRLQDLKQKIEQVLRARAQIQREAETC
jgi:two-component system, cell cycle sensor histidine kinase and response regulator CckA